MPDPYPLLLEPVFFEKVWGGRRLERLGKRLPPGKNIGESWEVADLPATAASGAGGGEVRSRIAGGALAGRTLHEAMGLWRDRLVATRGGDFPLLVKFLDAREDLSVQVHPSPEYAAANPGARLKTECWYVLDAEPGSVIYKGLRPGVSREQLADAARAGRVIDCLEHVHAVKGECHLLPSGTVHALGAGVLVVEVQTPSDTTFRLHDWGRAGRELHTEPGLACVSTERPPATTQALRGAAETPLATTSHFEVDEVWVHGDHGLKRGCQVVIVLEGNGRVEAGRAIQGVAPGASVVIPASLRARLSGDLRALLVTLP